MTQQQQFFLPQDSPRSASAVNLPEAHAVPGWHKGARIAYRSLVGASTALWGLAVPLVIAGGAPSATLGLGIIEFIVVGGSVVVKVVRAGVSSRRDRAIPKHLRFKRGWAAGFGRRLGTWSAALVLEAIATAINPFAGLVLAYPLITGSGGLFGLVERRAIEDERAHYRARARDILVAQAERVAVLEETTTNRIQELSKTFPNYGTVEELGLSQHDLLARILEGENPTREPFVLPPLLSSSRGAQLLASFHPGTVVHGLAGRRALAAMLAHLPERDPEFEAQTRKLRELAEGMRQQDDLARGQLQQRRPGPPPPPPPAPLPPRAPFSQQAQQPVQQPAAHAAPGQYVPGRPREPLVNELDRIANDLEQFAPTNWVSHVYGQFADAEVLSRVPETAHRIAAQARLDGNRLGIGAQGVPTDARYNQVVREYTVHLEAYVNSLRAYHTVAARISRGAPVVPLRGGPTQLLEVQRNVLRHQQGVENLLHLERRLHVQAEIQRTQEPALQQQAPDYYYERYHACIAQYSGHLRQQDVGALFRMASQQPVIHASKLVDSLQAAVSEAVRSTPNADAWSRVAGPMEALEGHLQMRRPAAQPSRRHAGSNRPPATTAAPVGTASSQTQPPPTSSLSAGTDPLRAFAAEVKRFDVLSRRTIDIESKGMEHVNQALSGVRFGTVMETARQTLGQHLASLGMRSDGTPAGGLTPQQQELITQYVEPLRACNDTLQPYVELSYVAQNDRPKFDRGVKEDSSKVLRLVAGINVVGEDLWRFQQAVTDSLPRAHGTRSTASLMTPPDGNHYEQRGQPTPGSQPPGPRPKQQPRLTPRPE